MSKPPAPVAPRKTPTPAAKPAGTAAGAAKHLVTAHGEADKQSPKVLGAKPIDKPATKPVAAVVPTAKTAAKPVAKPAPVAAATPLAEPAAVQARTPAVSTAAAKPEAKAEPAVKVPASAAKPEHPVTLKATPSKASSSRSAAIKLAAQNIPPMPTAAPLANRFTDRFAPARHMVREMHEAAELPKATRKLDPKLVNAWKSKAGRDLSEEEMLAMPESEYMNDKQLDFFRAELQKQKNDLLSNAGETTEHLREDTSIVPDPADRATIEEEHALELRTRDRERKLLKKIAQSLGRVDNGEYGFCDETGEPIGLARLMARPTATLSLEAQQRRELKQKMFGD